MTLKHEIVPAKELEEDTFIYLPDEKRFFYIDAIDYDGRKVILYFEEGVGEAGLISYSLEMGQNKKVIKIIL